MFDCPKCGASGKGVLLFNSVAPCDSCYGIKPVEKKGDREQYTIHQHRDLPGLGKYYRVALGCGYDKKSIETALTLNPNGGFFYDGYGSQHIPRYISSKPDGFCVVQWYK